MAFTVGQQPGSSAHYNSLPRPKQSRNAECRVVLAWVSQGMLPESRVLKVNRAKESADAAMRSVIQASERVEAPARSPIPGDLCMAPRCARTYTFKERVAGFIGPGWKLRCLVTQTKNHCRSSPQDRSAGLRRFVSGLLSLLLALSFSSRRKGLTPPPAHGQNTPGKARFAVTRRMNWRTATPIVSRRERLP